MAACMPSRRAPWPGRSAGSLSCWSPPGCRSHPGFPSRSARLGESVVRGRAPGAVSWQAVVQPEHLRPGAEREAELGQHRGALQPATLGSPRSCFRRGPPRQVAGVPLTLPSARVTGSPAVPSRCRCGGGGLTHPATRDRANAARSAGPGSRGSLGCHSPSWPGRSSRLAVGPTSSRAAGCTPVPAAAPGCRFGAVAVPGSRSAKASLVDSITRADSPASRSPLCRFRDPGEASSSANCWPKTGPWPRARS